MRTHIQISLIKIQKSIILKNKLNRGVKDLHTDKYMMNENKQKQVKGYFFYLQQDQKGL